MASRNYAPIRGALERGVVLVFARLRYDGTTATIEGKGVASVTRIAAGRYEITFKDKYLKLLGVSGVVFGLSPQPIFVSLEKQTASDTWETVATNGVLRVQIRQDNNNAVDPAATSEVLLNFYFKNSKS